MRVALMVLVLAAVSGCQDPWQRFTFQMCALECEPHPVFSFRPGCRVSPDGMAIYDGRSYVSLGEACVCGEGVK